MAAMVVLLNYKKTFVKYHQHGGDDVTSKRPTVYQVHHMTELQHAFSMDRL